MGIPYIEKPYLAMSPLISIITPSYNQGEYLEATLQFVLEQDYAPIEYLVIDGGSTDGSLEIIQRHAGQLAYWVSEPDNGQSEAINKGFRRATGDIIGWINSDDTLVPGVVRRVADFLAAHPDVDVVHGRVNWIDSAGEQIAGPTRLGGGHEFGAHNVLSSSIVQAGAFWRRRVTDTIGLLNEDLHYVMDYEFWARMALAGFCFRQLPGGPVANRRMTDTAKTGAAGDKMGREKLALLDQILADPALPGKLSLPLPAIRRQADKSRAIASLRVALAHSKRPGERTQAVRWFVKAVRFHPPILYSKHLAKSILYYRQSA